MTTTTQISSKVWEYTYSMRFTNSGANALGVQATLGAMPSGTTVVDGQSAVGAIASGETLRSTNTVTVRTSKQNNPVAFIRNNAMWTVVVQR